MIILMKAKKIKSEGTPWKMQMRLNSRFNGGWEQKIERKEP
jgi:hypothetical protein